MIFDIYELYTYQTLVKKSYRFLIASYLNESIIDPENVL